MMIKCATQKITKYFAKISYCKSHINIYDFFQTESKNCNDTKNKNVLYNFQNTVQKCQFPWQYPEYSLNPAHFQDFQDCFFQYLS